MTPGARAEAAIELLDAIIAAARDGGAAADALIARYFATRRYAGSKDRRAVRELVYRAIRRAGEVPAAGRAALAALADDDAELAASFDGSTHAPAPLEPNETRAPAGIAPAWLIELLAASAIVGPELHALVERAPLDLRVNLLKGSRDDALRALHGAEPTRHSAIGLRLPTGTSIEREPCWRDGLVEVQDEGSQLVGLAVGARPGERIVDLCAGAGGKALMLAAAMANHGELTACDIDRARLARLAPRAARAGATIIAPRLLDPGREGAMLADLAGGADAVVVDAPCSGTGTWRRNPEARWRLTPARLARLEAAQRHVLEVGHRLLRPGGMLVYVVCSLLDGEGSGQVDRFVAVHPGWSADPPPMPTGAARGQGWRLTPAHDGTDGFFVARLRAPC